ncbi:hypothetical protein Esti_006892 [Eimeria stiedai]
MFYGIFVSSSAFEQCPPASTHAAGVRWEDENHSDSAAPQRSYSPTAAAAAGEHAVVLPMSPEDWVLVQRLERKVDAQRFATVLKAYLILRTRVAARRADKEFKQQQQHSSSSTGLSKLNSRVALPEEEGSPSQAPLLRRASVIRLLWRSGQRPSAAAAERRVHQQIADYPKSVHAFEAAEGLLEQRLAFLGCRTVTAVGDGNCQFRAVSYCLFGSEENHRFVRRRVVQHMQRETASYRVFFESPAFDSYLKQMSRPGTWGDELTLRAAADAFSCCLHLITSSETNWYLRYDPEKEGQPQPALKHLFLTYISPIHYNAFHLLEGHDQTTNLLHSC